MKSNLKKFIKSFVSIIAKRNDIDSVAHNLYNKYSHFTMIPETQYIDNLKLCNQFGRIDGCIVECGVWRGGMIAGIAELLPGRKAYLFDSFEGLPPVKEIDGESAKKWQSNTMDPSYYDNCRAEIEYAQKAMELSEADAKIYKGWFHETLPSASITEQIAILRLDGDWYDSTMECLSNLFPLVAKGGLVIIDDYYVWDGCSKAVHDYLSRKSLTSRVRSSAKGIAFIIKQD